MGAMRIELVSRKGKGCQDGGCRRVSTRARPSTAREKNVSHARRMPSTLSACERSSERPDDRIYKNACRWTRGLLPDDGSPVVAASNRNIVRLNEALFGPQDYAVVATA